MPDNGATAIAAATSGRPTRSGPASEPVVSARVDPMVYLTTAAGDDVSLPEDPGGFIVLEPGASYRVRVLLYPDANGAIAIRGGAMQFWVVCDGVGGQVTSEKRSVSASEVVESPRELEFAFDIPANRPVGDGTLGLRYSQGLTNKLHELVRVRVEKGYYAAPAGFQEAVSVQLAPTPDKNLAIVHVAAAGDKVSVNAYHPSVANLLAVLPEPTMSLADVADERPSLEVYQSVDEYCRNRAGQLIDWLLKVLAQTSEELSIVIAEHVDSRVPWEMLVLEKGKPLLGERVAITRWTTIGQYAKTRLLDPTSEAAHDGRVLAFLDDRGLKHTMEETQQIDECASEPCDSLPELQKKLAALPGDVGLVFLSCHGVFVKDAAHQVVLEDAKNPSKKIKPLNLVGLPEPTRPPAIVINACHSARLVRTSEGISGFPEFFLGTFARSFLGTLGAVDDEAAGAVGAELVKAARRPGGVRIAEFLLQLRRRAAEEFKKEPRAWKFVSCFMYVFYGSPRDRLEIASRAPNAGGG